MKLIERLKQFRKSRPDLIVLLVALFLFCLVVNIILITIINQSTTPADEVVPDNLNHEGSNKAKEKEFLDPKNILKSLPYETPDFSATYLPLEKSGKLSIIVELFNDKSEAKFKEWFKQFEPVDYVEISYFEIEEIDFHPKGSFIDGPQNSEQE